MILAGRGKFRKASFLVPFIQLIFLMLFERNDPDPFHSGFVYSQSLAVSNGLLPNKNFLSPYGVIGPLLNGLWLHTFNNSLLSLLFLYGVISVSSGYIMGNELSRHTSPITGHLLSTVWIFSFATAMPWPSILTTFLTLVSVTLLLRNREKVFSPTSKRHLYLIPVVLFLDLAILTRIHLGITPLLITAYIFLKRKSINSFFVRTWFYLQTIFGVSIFLVLSLLGVLKPFINQVVVWPLTEFEKPPINLSFLVSFIWFPVALFLITFLTLIVFRSTRESSNIFSIVISVLPSLSILYLLYFFSKFEFLGSDITTLKTFPGFIKTASVNLQYLLGYASGAAAVLGLSVLILSKRNRKRWSSSSSSEFEFWLMASWAVTGMVQLYPLHDNVHLWFVTPLLLIPGLYLFKMLLDDFGQLVKPLNAVLVTVIIIQLLSFASFLSTPRVPLKSSELQGMFASEQYQETTDRTMQLLGRYVSGRDLRNNCKAGLFSVAGRKYRSIDGNFSDNFFGLFVTSTPVVDPSPRKPNLIFECGINSTKRDLYVSEGFEVIFEVPQVVDSSKSQEIFNVLFKRANSD